VAQVAAAQEVPTTVILEETAHLAQVQEVAGAEHTLEIMEEVAAAVQE
jgi:hypothetical protein